jgi:N-formylglutamate amidohydrolase
MKTVFSFLQLSKYSFVFEKKHNTGSYDPLSPELRNRLSEFFKPYNQKLEEYLGRKFDWE